MTKDELFEMIEENTMGPRCWSDIRTAVDAYTSALLQQHDVVRCKELLEQKMIEQHNLIDAGEYSMCRKAELYTPIYHIMQVLKFIEEPPAL